ncbi:MAG: hypothetical protein CNCCGFBP_00201 [Fimbriimonadaceae bacterium]|nr:hypothetical protein [Fimbriimonadaceae bacterium]
MQTVRSGHLQHRLQVQNVRSRHSPNSGAGGERRSLRLLESYQNHHRNRFGSRWTAHSLHTWIRGRTCDDCSWRRSFDGSVRRLTRGTRKFCVDATPCLRIPDFLIPRCQIRCKKNENIYVSRTARPITIDAELRAGGSEQDLSRWVEATRLIMKILDLKRIDEQVFHCRPYVFSRVHI